MPKIKTGYSKNILVHGKCRIVANSGTNRYVISPMTEITRPDGTKYYAYGNLTLVNKGEVSNIKEEEV